MRRQILLLLFLIILISKSFCYEPEDIYLNNWKTYTNTTYIHQICCKGDSIFVATWGGISVFNKKDSTFSALVKSDGLSKNEVRSVHYIPLIDEFWFGCYTEGISRYKDGEFIKPYQENQGVDADFINDIISNENYIFLGTDKGLNMFEINENGEHIFKKTFLSEKEINCITFDDSNRIWVGTNTGIDYVKAISYDYMCFPDNWYELGDEKITALDYCVDKIYFGTENGLGIIDISNTSQFNIQFPVFGEDLSSSEISAVLAQNDSTLWVAIGRWNETDQNFDNADGIYRFTSSDTVHWNDEGSILCNQISDIEVDDENNIWISTWEDGLFCFEDGEWKHYKRNCINSNLITVMMMDSNQNLWCGFGTKYPNTTSRGIKGVSQLDRNSKNWTNFRHNQSSTDSSLWSDRIFRMCEDKNGNKWFGTWGHGLGILNNSETEWTVHKAPDTEWMIFNGNSGNQVSLLECDNEANVWIGGYGATPGGVTILKPDSSFQQFCPEHLFEDTHATMWTMLLSMDKVWLGGFYTGIQYWDSSGFPETDGEHWRQFSGIDGSCFDFDIQETNYGNCIFAGGVDGLYLYDEGWNEWFKFTNGSDSNIKEYRWNGGDWDGWLAYEENEQRLGSGITNQINAVFVDPHGRKWLGTQGGGISMLDVNNFSFTNFNTENSDLCSDVVLSFAYNEYTGELFAGTSEGLSSFNIGASKKYKSESQIVEKLTVFPNPFKPAEHSSIYFEPSPNNELPHGKNNLYIYNFAGELIKILPESDRFRFCWDGKNDAGKNVASGIYFYVISSEFEDIHLNGKFVIIR